jgi:hypothetical protein
MSFARAYYSDPEVQAAFPGQGAPWSALQEKLDRISPHNISGEMYWLLLHFKKEDHREGHFGSATLSESIQDI